MVRLPQILIAVYVISSSVLRDVAVCEEKYAANDETLRPPPTAVGPPGAAVITATVPRDRDHGWLLNVTHGGDCSPGPGDSDTVLGVATTLRTITGGVTMGRRAGRSVNRTAAVAVPKAKQQQKPKTTPRPPPGAAKPKGPKSTAAGTTARTTARTATGTGTTTTDWPKFEQRLPPPPTSPKDGTTNRTNDTRAPTDHKDEYLAQTGKWKDHGFYTDDYIHLINVHWFKFHPPADTSHYVLGTLYTIIMVFGCFGNSLVIFMYIK